VGQTVTKKYLSVREYAETFGVSVATVYAMCAIGKPPHTRLGTGRGTIRIPIEGPGYQKTDGQAAEPPARPRTKQIKPRYLVRPS
jgi:excisionase family DNA binding protein